MSHVRRLYVEKRPQFAVSAKALSHEIRHYLEISGLKGVRVLIRYDMEGVSDEIYEKAKDTVFSEPPVDILYEEKYSGDGAAFSVEFLPGQFDQRADSAEQCIKLLDASLNPVIHTAITYVLEGELTSEEISKIKEYCINPVDSREAGEDKPDTLFYDYPEPEDVKILDGFCDMSDDELRALYNSLSLAMTFRDFLHIKNYFSTEEKRNPSMTEIRVLDTYWSDHCRHTTFSTELTKVEFEEGDYTLPMKETYQDYLDNFKILYKDRNDKYVCLMDLALMAMKCLKKEGKLQDQEESDEINACSIVIPVDVDGTKEEWLLNFKNETHNHPTEIEPFGGAATCLGGAIRDPLSGRTYVYQAMRVTGAADPTLPVADTMEGKLPQKKLVREAAHGYSSYGNQIGLATGYVKEIYHPGYVAKRMEIGGVLGAAPRRAVRRMTSDPGDVIILLGGRTGRDGIGGATGSSKAHTTQSTEECGAEVQKGNPPTERKLQRLFRREEVSSLIKKCNDFGAGGVSVAVGELADGLLINLDSVPKKYAGLDGTELAISESQERMAVVLDPSDVNQFLKYAAEENLEAVEVARVTESPRLVMNWRGKEIVNLSRAFLDTNGAHQETTVYVESPKKEENFFNKNAIASVDEDLQKGDVVSAMKDTLSDLNVCSQKGLVEMFDSSIGAGSVLMPYGGKYQLTETQSMVAKIPVLSGETSTVSMMSYGFDPYLSSWSPYHGAMYAVTESVSRIVAAGGDYEKIRFSFQEYFRRMSEEPSRWSQPMAALLGAYRAQMEFGLPSIGGKDSMSGTFNDIDVPPTLVSFAVDWGNEENVITPELKQEGNALVFFRLGRDGYDLPDIPQAKRLFEAIYDLITKKAICSAYSVDAYGIFAALAKMSLGNKKGVALEPKMISKELLFAPVVGSIVAEVPANMLSVLDNAMADFELGDYYQFIGEVTAAGGFSYGDLSLSYEEVVSLWSTPLEKVFASKSSEEKDAVEHQVHNEKNIYVCKHPIAKPRVFIPVFPGTNCEYDSARAFEKAGAEPVVRVFKNQSAQDITDSVDEFSAMIQSSQMIMFPGGFSAGDEPEGSAKFFATAFRNEKIKEQVEKLLNERDGLVLGICNGFQALIKLGLVPFGEIRTQEEGVPTLTYNTIGRHVSKVAYTKVISNKSPWLLNTDLEGVYSVPASHGEGRFVASEEWLKKLQENGQIATVYSDPEGNVSMDETWNINGSYLSIEGITSPDGRVYGKMCHSERIGNHVAMNIYGQQDMKLFESGVSYFR